MEVDITRLSAVEDVKIIGDSSYIIHNGSVMVSRRSSFSDGPSAGESDGEMSFTAAAAELVGFYFYCVSPPLYWHSGSIVC